MPSRLQDFRDIGLVATLVALTGFLGCTLPSDQGDIDYPTYGGAWQRTRPDGGRVGSIFDPAGGKVANLAPKTKPRMDDPNRSASDSILSVTPDERKGDSEKPEEIERPDREKSDAAPPEPDARSPKSDDGETLPSPSDRKQRDRLRSIELDQISAETEGDDSPELQ
jgi:hypothetical protein